MDGLSDAKINAAHSVDVRLRINGQDEWWCGESYIKGLIREVAALRKKVEKRSSCMNDTSYITPSLSKKLKTAADKLHRENVVAVKKLYDDNAALRKRVEDAEDRVLVEHEALLDMRRQRDELQAYVSEDLIPTQAKLQADLDAALTCYLSLTTNEPRAGTPESRAAIARIRPMLEKRRENRG